MRRAHQHPRTWKVLPGQGEDAQNVVIELPDRDLAFSPLNAELLGAALQRTARQLVPGIGRGSAVNPTVHLLRDDFTLACGADGKVSASGVLAEVTCSACKGGAQ